MDFKARAKELVGKMTLEETMSRMRYDAPAIERRGIPAYNWWNEGLHGVALAGRATVFRQSIGMSASFDTELMQKVATIISDEVRANYNEYNKFGNTERYEGLTYSENKEKWLDENTVELTNKGEFDTAYSVLKFEYIPHKNLCGFKKVFLSKGEKMTVVFDGKDE